MTIDISARGNIINTNRLPFTAKAEFLPNGTIQHTQKVSRAKDPKKFSQAQVYSTMGF